MERKRTILDTQIGLSVVPNQKESKMKREIITLGIQIGLTVLLLNITVRVVLPTTSILPQLATLITVAANMPMVVYISLLLCELTIEGMDLKTFLICVSVSTGPPYIIIFIVLPYLYQCLVC